MPYEFIAYDEFHDASQMFSFGQFVWHVFTNCRLTPRFGFRLPSEFMCAGGRDEPFILPGGVRKEDYTPAK